MLRETEDSKMANILDRISKETFDIAYDNHIPSKWIKFAFKYFSRESEKNALHLKDDIAYGLLILFTLSLLEAIFNAPKIIILWTIITYSILLVAFITYLLSAVFANNWRIRQIRKELGVTREEYDILVSAYY